MDDGSLSYWLSAHPVVTGLAVLAFIIAIGVVSRIPTVRKVLRTILFLPVAAALAVLGAFMVVLWRPVHWLTGLLLHVLPFGRWLANLPEHWTANVGNRLALGKREAVARSIWPEEQYPELYRKVPADIVRPLYEDGRLIGGAPVRWLGDRHMTEATQMAAARIGAESAVLVVLLGLVLPLLAVLIDLVSFGMDFIGGGSRPVIDAWPGTEPVLLSRWAMLMADLHVSLNMLTHDLVRVVAILPGTLLFAAGVAMLTFIAMAAIWYQRQTAGYRLVTKDADVRWAFRAETRDTLRRTYRRQVEHATGYLKDAKTFKVGTATGVLRVRGDLAAPANNQPLMLDTESLFQHTIVFGGTGEGKTTALLKPLMRQVWADKRFGSFVADAKGVLWKDAMKVATDLGREKDVVILGTGPGQHGVNMIAGMTPTQVVSVVRTVMSQLGAGDMSGTFWADMAATILRHSLTVGAAYAETDDGRKFRAEEQLNPYSLWWAYQAIVRPDWAREAIAAVNDAHGVYFLAASKTKPGTRSAVVSGAGEAQRSKPVDDGDDGDIEPPAFKSQANEGAGSPDQGAVDSEPPPKEMSAELKASIAYIQSTWETMAEQTKTGIIANLTQILDGFAGTPTLLRRFVCGLDDEAVALELALDGKIVLNALSSIEDGLPARLTSIFMKTNLYRLARVREAVWKAETPPRSPQDRPCLVMMDEVQELVTADPASGLSDATFWNVARSSGLAGVFATQTISGLMMAIGKEAALNFLQQTRSKIFFRVEEQETVDYACWLAGAYERNRVVEDEHRESLEHRLLLDGWTPLAPLEDDRDLVFGPRALFAAAGTLLQPDGASFALPRAQPYEADARFMPKQKWLPDFITGERGGDQSYYLAQLGAAQAAAWRAEDLNRNYRMHGNEVQPALTPADMLHMGRWHAFAQIQRAGALRQDIIMVEHDFA
jgi:hypothetical protein